jgi:hypothetical protein
MKRYLTLAYICLTGGLTAFATPVTPTYTTFGPLNGAEWGGTGNPNDPVAITTIKNGDFTVTLGLAAQQRYFNPPLANDGAGTYFATPGANQGGPGNPSSFLGSTWNFDFYFDATGGSYTYKLFYGTASSLVSVDPTKIGDNGSTPHNGGQNSENLLFPAWGTSGSFVLNTLPFDPNANATYIFELVAYNAAGTQVGETAINVQVGSVPDIASTAGLLGLGIVGLMFVNSRRTRLARVTK